MSLAGFLIAFATLVAAGFVIVWIIRAERTDEQPAKPRPEPARTEDDDRVRDDPVSALKRAVEAGEAEARRGKPGRGRP
jgi:hypothetical protein